MSDEPLREILAFLFGQQTWNVTIRSAKPDAHNVSVILSRASGVRMSGDNERIVDGPRHEWADVLGRAAIEAAR